MKMSDNLYSKVSFGGGGDSGSRSGGSSTHTSTSRERVNREGKGDMKVGRDRSFLDKMLHGAANSGLSVSGGSGGGSITLTPTCGSCHDPFKN